MGSLPPLAPLCDISSKLSTHETNLITPNSRRPIREKTGWNPIFIRKHKQRNIYLYNTATKKCKKSFQTDYTDRRWGLLKNLLKKPRNHKGESRRTVGGFHGAQGGKPQNRWGSPWNRFQIFSATSWFVADTGAIHLKNVTNLSHISIYLWLIGY